jgi:predicted DNA-binding transcriptional regulator
METTTEVRDAVFRKLRGKLAGLRLTVYENMLRLGPRTTRELAEAMRLSILTVRPRVSELYELGLARMEGTERGVEGRYMAVPLHDACRHAADAKEAEGKQLNMRLEA